MKKMLCALMALMMLACGFAFAETIAPQMDVVNTTDAIWKVEFDRDAIRDGVMNGVHLFSEDIYDIVDVEKMAVGDTFVAEGNEITIQSIERNEFGNIDINGGFSKEGGYTLTTEEGTNGWMTTMENDFSTCTDRGVYDLEMAGNVTLTDSWDIDGQTEVATGIEAVTRAIMESPNPDFHALNTDIRLEDGKVVEINRHYVP